MGKWESGNVGTENGRPAGLDVEPASAPAGAQRRVRRFEDLDVWQAARILAKGVYRAAESQRLGHDYAMLNQMKRAVVSISSNIAEGYERGTRKQQIEACFVAKGSAGELRSQVIIARDVGLLDDQSAVWLLDACEKSSRMLAAYILHLQRSSKSIVGYKQSLIRDAQHAAEAEKASSVPTFPLSHIPTPDTAPRGTA